MDAMLAWADILASDKTAGEPQSEARNANTGGDCERVKPRAIDFYGNNIGKARRSHGRHQSFRHRTRLQALQKEEAVQT